MGEKTALKITENIVRAIDELRCVIECASHSPDIERLSKSILYLSIAHEKLMKSIQRSVEE